MASPFVRFINEKSFIQVKNLRTGVVAWLNKSPLLIQRDSDVSFLLKNDTYIGYYKYSDVEFPTTADIDDLMRTLVAWVETRDEREQLERDAKTLVDIRTNYQSSAVDVQELALTNATSSYDPDKLMVQMQVTTDDGTRIVRQSRQYIPATFVSEILAVQQAILTDGNATTNVTSRVGVFEDLNDISVNTTYSGRGAFFEAFEGQVSAVYRSNDGTTQTDKKVAQASWNLDPLDGNGPSGYLLDPTVPQLYVFEYDPVPRKIRLGVLVTDVVYYCHEFGPTTSGAEDVRRLNVPLRWEITQTDPGSGTLPGATATMFQGKATLFYVKDPTVATRSTDVGLNRKVNNENGVTIPLFSLRLREEFNRALLMVKRLTILNAASGGIAKWELVLNPTLTNQSFADVPEAFSQFSTAETDATGGKVMASGFIIDAGQLILDLEKNGIYATSSIAGTPDVLTLRITNISGVVEVLSGIDWYEKE